jgi:hypothetical protein
MAPIRASVITAAAKRLRDVVVRRRDESAFAGRQYFRGAEAEDLSVAELSHQPALPVRPKPVGGIEYQCATRPTRERFESLGPAWGSEQVRRHDDAGVAESRFGVVRIEVKGQWVALSESQPEPIPSNRMRRRRERETREQDMAVYRREDPEAQHQTGSRGRHCDYVSCAEALGRRLLQ